MSFESAFEKVVIAEGGYSDHASDPGGKTMYGITEAVARANGYARPMPNLSLDIAKSIYKRQYWDTIRLDEIDAVSPGIAHELFDTGVNMGVGVAGKFLQRALNVFNRRGADYLDLTVDGVVGPMSVATVKALIAKRGKDGETVMLRALNAQQAVRYMEIAEGRQASEDFIFGWFKARVT